MTAEQAEEKRIATQATQPAPAASNPAAFGGFVAAPFVKPVSVSTSAPAIAGRSITIDTGNKATSTINTQPSTQPKITSAPSASAAQAQPVPPIPDPINQDPAPEASSNSSQ